MAAASPIDLLGRALAQSTDLVSAVTPDQLDWQTPCTELVVRDLLRHMVGGLRNPARLPTPDRTHLQTTAESSARAGAQGLVGDRDNDQTHPAKRS